MPFEQTVHMDIYKIVSEALASLGVPNTLLRCPFCGGETKLDVQWGANRYIASVNCPNHCIDRAAVVISDDNSGEECARQLCILKWNTMVMGLKPRDDEQIKKIQSIAKRFRVAQQEELYGLTAAMLEELLKAVEEL